MRILIFAMFFFLAQDVYALDSSSLGKSSVLNTNINIVKPSDVPIGSIMAWNSYSMPENGDWLECNGQAVPADATEYRAKFGSYTPDYSGRFLEGSANPGINKEAGLPNITGNWGIKEGAQPGEQLLDVGASLMETSGALFVSSWRKQWYACNYVDYAPMANGIGFDASKSNPIYGASNTVQPRSSTVKYIIKIR